MMKKLSIVFFGLIASGASFASDCNSCCGARTIVEDSSCGVRTIKTIEVRTPVSCCTTCCN